jgi:hypothetical protein
MQNAQSGTAVHHSQFIIESIFNLVLIYTYNQSSDLLMARILLGLRPVRILFDREVRKDAKAETSY